MKKWIIYFFVLVSLVIFSICSPKGYHSFKAFIMNDTSIEHIASSYFCFKFEDSVVSKNESIVVKQITYKDHYLEVNLLGQDVKSPVAGIISKIGKNYIKIETINDVLTIYLDTPKCYLYTYVNIGTKIGKSNSIIKIESKKNKYEGLPYATDFEEA